MMKVKNILLIGNCSLDTCSVGKHCQLGYCGHPLTVKDTEGNVVYYIAIAEC
jgi:hypothetical protein